MQKNKQILSFSKDKKIIYFYVLTIIATGFLVIYLLFGHSSNNSANSNPKLTDACISSEKQEQKIRLESENGLIVLPHYSFHFPYLEWIVEYNLLDPFEEQIVFPPILGSVHFSYPYSNNTPLFLRKENKISVAFSIAKDNCVSVDSWFEKIPDAYSYNKTYQAINGKKWLIAISENKTPIHIIAFMHDKGYHYEFNFLIRDKETNELYKNLLEQVLGTFKEIKQS